MNLLDFRGSDPWKALFLMAVADGVSLEIYSAIKRCSWYPSASKPPRARDNLRFGCLWAGPSFSFRETRNRRLEEVLALRQGVCPRRRPFMLYLLDDHAPDFALEIICWKPPMQHASRILLGDPDRSEHRGTSSLQRAKRCSSAQVSTGLDHVCCLAGRLGDTYLETGRVGRPFARSGTLPSSWMRTVVNRLARKNTAEELGGTPIPGNRVLNVSSMLRCGACSCRECR